MQIRTQIVASLVLTGRLVVASCPASAGAPEPVEPDGLDLGLRLGFAIPVGSISGISNDFGSAFSGLIPLTLEAERRFNRLYAVGPFFQYGRALVRGGGTTSEYLFGLQAIICFDALGSVTPWIGLGAGYEILDVGGFSLRGFEFATLQGGGEFHPSPGFGVGPFVGFSFGEFTTASDGSNDQDVPNPGVHGWLELGLRLDWSL